MAALLGTVYIDLMSFIVSWYGDLPEKAAWYLRRGQDGWNWVIVSAVLVGALVPVAMLLSSRLRANRQALRLIGGLILVGVVLHILWLMAPGFEPGAIVAALAALIALASLSIAIAEPMQPRSEDGTMTDDDMHAEQRPESPEVAARTVLFTALSLVAFVGLSILGARIYYDWEMHGPVNVAPQTFGKPRLQIDDAADLAKFEKEQQAQLNGYAWVDRESEYHPNSG